MSLFTNGLEYLQIGSTSWRDNVNRNLVNVYTSTESDSLIAGKSEISHAHPTLWPLPTLIVSADISPVTSTITDDLAFNSTFSPLLVDRVTGELYRLSVASGTVSITATGVFASTSPNEINNTGASINNVAYPSIINGDII